MKNVSIRLVLLTAGMMAGSSCSDIEKAEEKWNQLRERVEKLDSVIDTETDKVYRLDSLIEQEMQKIEKLDSLIEN